ncbi:MAG: glycosyltransferase [Ktedonobacteraceae bacterium]
MIETSDLHYREGIETLNSVQSQHKEQKADRQPGPGRKRWMGQVLRFGMVGGLNTIVDLLILNTLLLLFPTNSTRMILIFGAIAYSIGAVNSFLLNKYWTFGYRQRTSWREVVRFVVTTLLGIGWSSVILWLASNALQPLLINPTIWANVSKVIAICGTVLINYLGMSLWVFVSKTRKEYSQINEPVLITNVPSPVRYENNTLISNGGGLPVSSGYVQSSVIENESENEAISNHSISVVLPAYNEEQIIASTVFAVLHALNSWCMDFEILVVNDGSTDATGEIVAALVDTFPRVRLITHATNQGYGSSLVSGFAAATKELVFFMDSDGQFDIQDLQEFFPLIDTYDAVIGYRIDRQDSWMRKLNAWGWKQLIGWVLGVHVRDVDCAYKLLHTEFLHQHPLETRGAMINAELLYRLRRAGCSYMEVGVIHLPRLHGQATGAKLSVILRAFCELFVSARKWNREEQKLLAQPSKRELQTRG